MQTLSGPRQVGKTTLAKRAIDSFSGQSHYATADQTSAPDANWIVQHWEFVKTFPNAKPLVVGTGGVSIKEFLLQPPAYWLTR